MPSNRSVDEDRLAILECFFTEGVNCLVQGQLEVQVANIKKTHTSEFFHATGECSKYYFSFTKLSEEVEITRHQNRPRG